jgi:hypothetical protein
MGIFGEAPWISNGRGAISSRFYFKCRMGKQRDAKLIELRYFAGMNNDEAAAAINFSAATGRRVMNYAKA